MLDIYKWSVLITAIFWTSFGIFAYIKNHKDFSTRLFALLSVSFATYSYSWFFLLRTTDAESAFFFSRILACAAPFIVIFYLHWAFSVLNIHNKRKLVIFLCYVINVIFFFFILIDPSYISDVKPIMFFPFWPVAGHNYVFFLVFGYGLTICYSVYELIKGYQNSNGDKKHQIIYLMLGSLLGFGGGVTNFPLMYGLNIIQPFGVFAIMASPFIYSYAAVRYKLMDIKVVATQFFAGAMNVIFLINLILSETVSEKFFNTFLLIFVIVFTILLIKGVRKEIQQRERIQLLATDLEKANVRLTELDRQKSEFVSFATHQLRAPLTAMKGYASLILEGDMGKITEETRGAIGRIFESSNTLTSIVDDYLNVTRIELGTMKYAFETIDLKTLIEDVIAELKPNIDKSTNVKFLFGAENAGTDYRITADRDKLKQVIANLIDNSLKYTPKGSVGVSLSFNRAKHKFVFMIKDTGIGIAPETLPHLFAKFSRASNANKTNIKGTGLGLFVAKEIVVAHHGTIRAESMGEGKGSTFVVEFEPFAKA